MKTKCLHPSKSHFVISPDSQSIRFEPCQIESSNTDDIVYHFCPLCKELIKPKAEWFTEQSPGGALTLIKNSENMIVGSIMIHQGKHQVEILWGGPSGEIKGEFSDLAQALCFVEGVNKSMIAMKDIRG